MSIKMLQQLAKFRTRTAISSTRSPLAEGLGFTIRLAYPDDEPSLQRLAALDSQPLPEGRLLVAEVGGELWAAVGIGGGRHVVADPFHRTATLVSLLQHQAEALATPDGRRPAPRGAPASRIRDAQART